MEFAETHLAVAYRAAKEPQLLNVQVRTAGVAETPFAAAAIQAFVDLANAGGAGGSELSPASGKAKIVTQPIDPQGTDRTWVIEVAGVSPRALRNLVEAMRRAGDGHAVTSLSVWGELAPDGSPLSVREDVLRRWLAGPDMHLERWAEVPFGVNLGDAARGGRVRASVRGGTTPELLEAFESLITLWMVSILDYPDHLREKRGTLDRDPRIGRTRGELSANFARFDYATAPAWALLCNLLCGFHERSAKLLEVDVALS
jgi:hypothetical protein